MSAAVGENCSLMRLRVPKTIIQVLNSDLNWTIINKYLQSTSSFYKANNTFLNAYVFQFYTIHYHNKFNVRNINPNVILQYLSHTELEIP